MHPDILRLHAVIEEDHWWFVGRRRILGDVLDALVPGDEGATILDLGCGTGANIGYLSEWYRCWGLELDPEAVAYAAERYPACQFTCGSVLDLATWPELDRIDACLLTDVIEHIEDDRTAVLNATNALAPGGHLVITVPADPRLWSKHDRDHGHYRRYTQETLAETLSGLPLRRRALTSMNARLYQPIRFWRRVQKWIPLLESGTTGDTNLPPRLINPLLTRLFSGESSRVCRAIDGPPTYDRGVSLLAVYQRI